MVPAMCRAPGTGNPANVTLAAWVKLGSADSNGSEVISLGDSGAAAR